ncbi:phage holin family protein [Ramlibacter pallidus]|uniref:Phage holin family protein n=1 Tax=Ramlibacter pallidus TaxID=2780087 RepID=A0ABR9S933_9BURK|nr:phage holin family protein [Ramlibacter pallidus]MBE7369482.1 phage holin family protein [Ramlibacter pallidus]
MLHPIFSVLVAKPELVMEHVAGYASLMREEASSVGKEVAKRAVAWGVTLFSALVFLILAGVAVMLAAIQDQFHWAFVLVPAIPLALALVGFSAARKPLPEKAFTELKAQLDADAQALRAIGARS